MPSVARSAPPAQEKGGKGIAFVDMKTDNGRTRSYWMATADTPAPGAGRAPRRRRLRRRRRHRRADDRLPARPRGQDGRRARRRPASPAARPAAPPPTSSCDNDDGLTEIERLHGDRRAAARRREPRGGHRPDRADRRATRRSTATSTALDGYLFVSPDGPGARLPRARSSTPPTASA